MSFCGSCFTLFVGLSPCGEEGVQRERAKVEVQFRVLNCWVPLYLMFRQELSNWPFQWGGCGVGFYGAVREKTTATVHRLLPSCLHSHRIIFVYLCFVGPLAPGYFCAGVF